MFYSVFGSSRPLNERVDLPLAANKAFPSINSATNAPEAFEASLVSASLLPLLGHGHILPLVCT